MVFIAKSLAMDCFVNQYMQLIYSICQGDLLDCELAQIASFEGRVRWMPTTDANLYTAAVECAEGMVLFTLTEPQQS